MIDERKLLAIELLVDGVETRTSIADKIGISRQTLYDWMDNEEFKAALDKRLQNRKIFVEKMIDSKLEFVVDEMFKLATDSDNSRVKADILKYLTDRALGKPSTKIELEAEYKQRKDVDEDILKAEFEAVDSEDK